MIQNPILTLEGVTKVFDTQNTPAVYNISLELCSGSYVSLTGPSGCGKSTLLHLIAGLIDPTSGALYFKGNKIKGPSEQLLPGHPEIETVYQDYKLFEFISVLDHVSHYLRRYKPEFSLPFIEKLIKICGLEGLESKMPHMLSGGQKQRTAIARALSKRPSLLLLDEPFSHLDPVARRALRSTLREIYSHEALSMIYVTHDPEEALSSPGLVAYMENGKIIQIDTPENLYIHPKNISIASFFGIFFDLSWLTNKACGIREEKILLSHEKSLHSFEGNVRYSSFTGSGYRITVDIADHTVSVLHSIYLEANSKIFIHFPESEYIYFE